MADPETKEGASASEPNQPDPAASLESAVAATETETKPEEKKEAATQPKEEVDENHPTKLGRKVKDLSEKFETFMTRFDEFARAKTQERTEPTQKGEVSDRYEEDIYDRMCKVEPPPVEYVTTPKEQVLVRQWEQRVTEKMQNASRQGYVNSYMGKLGGLTDEGGEHHAQIVHMLTAEGSPYNRYQTGNGAVDAELNYHRAHKAILSGKEKPKTTFGKQEKAEGSGPTIPNQGSTPTVTAPKLDPLAADYAKSLGLNDEEIADAMNRYIPGLSKA